MQAADRPRDSDLGLLLGRPDALEIVLVLAAGAAWLLYLTPASAGFHDVATAATSVAFLPALLAVRPWRTAPSWVLPLVMLTGVGGFLALLLAPAGWMQADSLSAQLLGLLALVIVSGFARSPARRRGVVLFLVLGIATQFLPAWKAWHGSDDPNTLMVGTFYWHNQLGIWMVALGLLAAAHALRGPGRSSRWLAALLTVVAFSSVVLSTSRTDLGLLSLGYLALLPVAVLGTRPLRTLLTWAALPLATAVGLLFLTSPLFFDKPWHGISAVQVTADNPGALGNRGTSSLSTNGGDRWRWSKSALSTWREAPWVGDGFGSFRFTVQDHVEPGQNVSSFVHDGYAEALTSGGLAFGLPLLAVCAVIGLSAVRRYVQSLGRGHPERAVMTGSAVAALALLAHSAVDFDWHYPSLVVLLGGIAGILVARDDRRRALRHPWVYVPCLTALVALTLTSSVVEHHGRQTIAGSGTRTAAQLLDARVPATDDPRIDLAALQACLRTDGTLAVSTDTAQRALAASRGAGSLDPEIARLRQQVSDAVRTSSSRG